MTYSHMDNLRIFFVNWCAYINLCFIGTILSVTVLPGNNLQFGTVSSGIVLSVHQFETFFFK